MTAATKLDLFKANRADYTAPKKPKLVDIAPASYLCINGRGEPGAEAFQDCIGTLYGAAFTIKFISKKAGRDYAVCKLEAQWWDKQRYRMMIRTPEFIGNGLLDDAREALASKGKTKHLDELYLENILEGRCIQMLHVGPYDRENETIDIMRSFAEEQGMQLHSAHHEIYLSDPRRVEPERLKTILRYPVR